MGDDLKAEVPGVTSKMLVKFGENDIKSVEDLAGCATDDLVGWTERKEGGEPTKFPGILDANEISRDDAERLIMQARVMPAGSPRPNSPSNPESRRRPPKTRRRDAGVPQNGRSFCAQTVRR